MTPSPHRVLLLKQATLQYLQIWASFHFSTQSLNTQPQAFSLLHPVYVFFFPPERSIKKFGCLAAVKFFGQHHKTLNLFMDFSLGCLRDEVMWVRMQRMGFSAETDAGTTHLISSEVTWLGSTTHRVCFCFPSEAKLVTGGHHPCWSGSMSMQLGNLVSMCLHLKALVCQLLWSLRSRSPHKSPFTLYLSGEKAKLQLSAAYFRFSVLVPGLALPIFPLHYQPVQCVLGDIFGINGHMITGQQVTQ